MTLPPPYEIDCHAVASELREAMTKTEAVSDERFTRLELHDLFGDEMPMEAARLIFGPDNESMTIGAIRAKVREIALSRRAANSAGRVEVFDMAAHLQRQRDWSGKTFGPGPRTAGVVDHIRKELREIEADPSDITEWIDVVILALDGAWRAGYQPQEIIDAMVAKQTRNEGRNWPDWRTMSPDKAIEHDRSGEASSPAVEAEPVACISVAGKPEGHIWIKTDGMPDGICSKCGTQRAWLTHPSSPVSAEVTEAARKEALRLLQERDNRDDQVQEIIEDLREIVLLMPAASRPEGLMKKAQDATYAMRGRLRLMDDAALTAALDSVSAPLDTDVEAACHAFTSDWVDLDEYAKEHYRKNMRAALLAALNGKE